MLIGRDLDLVGEQEINMDFMVIKIEVILRKVINYMYYVIEVQGKVIIFFFDIYNFFEMVFVI